MVSERMAIKQNSRSSVASHTERIVTTIAEEPKEDGGAVQRKFRFYRTVKSKDAVKQCVSYVFHADLFERVCDEHLKSVRDGKHNSVIWYALSKHAASPCSGLFEEPTDHYHLLVWFDDGAGKAMDKGFHKWFYRFMHGKQRKSQSVRSERAMLQYIQCEPRELIELYSSAQHAKFVQQCYDSRHEMQTKIDEREKKKTKGTAKINYVSENDWWQEHDCNPQAIVDCMVKNGIRDVNRFLLWLGEHEPDKTMGSLTFHREKGRLEKEINMSVRRYWYTKNILVQLESRRKQCNDLRDKGLVLSVKDSINALRDIITKNGYDFQKFVNDVFDILFKRKNKVNTLYLFGKSNSCKSTVAWSIINCTPNYSQGMASAEFMYHNCANSSIIFFEEMKITPDVVCEMKRVLEGSEVCTNRKFGDGFYLPRTPVVALSNYVPWEFCPGEKDTLLNRMCYYEFKVHESNKKYDVALNPLMWKELHSMYKPPVIKAKDLFY